MVLECDFVHADLTKFFISVEMMGVLVNMNVQYFFFIQNCYAF